MNYYANLHLHSTHSDGKYTPTQLVEIAKAEGYRAAALTDHDTITGYPEFKAACDALGLETIFGVEFTAPTTLYTKPDGRQGTFHITAYHFDPEYPEMKDYLTKMGLREIAQTQTLFERGVRLGLIQGITWEEVLDYNKGIAWLCNEHVFRAMKAKGLVTDLDYRAFFKDCFGKYRSEVPPLYRFKQVDEIIRLVHAAGGIALVAHPHNLLQHLDALIEMGIDGMEVWHPDLPMEERTEAYRLGLEKNLYISGGSDHSGLCGGQYVTYTNPKESIHYIDPLSVGTTKEYYEEIRDRQKRR